ncbi:MAG TPA: membrane protein insertase YidC [Candidatus Cybelea sp.]|nr:membrane protein insertase YidC [Candidatus Cybelea sp.]
MSEQRNLIVFIIFSIAILTVFQFVFRKPQDTTQVAHVQEQAASAQKPGEATGSATTATAKPGETPSNAAVPGVAASGAVLTRAQALAAGPRIRIATRRLSGSIALTGARIDDLSLPDYRETVDPKSPAIELLSPPRSEHPYFAEFGWTPAESGAAKVPDDSTVWQTDATTLTGERPVTLTWDNGQGLRFVRTIAVDNDYIFTVGQRVENRGDKPVKLYPYGLVSRYGTPDTLGYTILHEGPVGVLKDKLVEHSYKDLVSKGAISDDSTGGWVGITDKYWLAALVPDQNAQVTTSFHHTAGGPYKDIYQVDYLGEALIVPPGGSAQTSGRLFAGAKEVKLLSHYEDTLGIKRFDLAIDWGWFWFLTKPIFIAIDFFYALLGNFGLAILLLTLLIKLAFVPLAHKSYVSMSAMKKLQPEMMKLRERYAEDKQKLNTEMMALYKQHKVNPAAGCLPIVLQIPVFFSLYKVLFVTIEMRHAPFYGWIHDLSAQDPTNIFTLFGVIPWDAPSFLSFGIWPILMGLTMYLQQKLSPQSPDPMQARIFMFMPLFMTYLLHTFPAGLVIYWTWNNLLSIAQQWFIMKRMGATT